MAAKLIMVKRDGQRVEFPLTEHNTLGRHPNQTIQIMDRVISKEHAVIEQVDGRFAIKDLGSRNGTFINAERIQESVLNDGDEVMLGSTSLFFVEERPQTSLSGKVTITPAGVETSIRSRIARDEGLRFLPEEQIQSVELLRQDYEKLRIAHELYHEIGLELDLLALLRQILEKAFQILPADRGVILVIDQETGELEPKVVKHRDASRGNENIVLSSTIIQEVLREKASVLSSDAMMDSRFTGSHSIIIQSIRSTMVVPLICKDDLLGVICLDTQVATGAFTEKDLQILSGIANQAATLIENARLAKKIEEEALTREKLGRMLSPNLVEQVVQGKLELKRGGEVRKATILFSDIRGFTSMSEKGDAQDIVDMLNEYFEQMVEVVFKFEGTLDKFMGDALMALWGAPINRPYDPYKAVSAAVEMQKVLVQFNQGRVAKGMDPIKAGIGIDTGSIVAGYIGSTRTMEYTAIGDHVNTAARLCALAEPDQIIISDNTCMEVKDYFIMEPLPPAKVKGKAEPLKIYSVLARREAVEPTLTGQVWNGGGKK